MYPDKNLAGVGVAFKLAHALLREHKLEHEGSKLSKDCRHRHGRGRDEPHGRKPCDRRVVCSICQRLNSFGLKALMEVADCTSEMTSYHIGFRIGPRINAAGRMDVARHVIELFEEPDFAKARQLASLLDTRNRERQQMQQKDHGNWR